ncbi:PREDICTED: LYR motif-containing protein 4, partial [Pterocles gutturalis]|uniref:LYR motif-containing protein 4 n=1 Tax=Pterocles gutturalis TaxID=240206 RepID=UPI0005283538
MLIQHYAELMELANPEEKPKTTTKKMLTLVVVLSVTVSMLGIQQTYAIRRIRDAFRENKNIKDSEKIEELLNKAKTNLEVIHRQ